jgi:AcrR family transcriptional regulator
MKKSSQNSLDAPDAADLSAPRPRRSSYSSPSIVERRRRILSTARDLIAEKGMADVSMDELAARTRVAKRTLYNIFTSRDLLFATAIQQYFRDFEIRIRYSTPPATVERIVEHLFIVTRRTISAREYTKTLLTAYFTSFGAPDIRQAIFEIAAHAHRPWVERLHAEGDLSPWIDPDILIEDLVRYRYSVGIDWAYGRLHDLLFAPTLIRGVLTIVRGAAGTRIRRTIDYTIQGIPRTSIAH